jgi:hypothetical protein
LLTRFQVSWGYGDNIWHSSPDKPWKGWKRGRDANAKRLQSLRDRFNDLGGADKLRVPSPIAFPRDGRHDTTQDLKPQELDSIALEIGKLVVNHTFAEDFTRIREAIMEKRYNSPEWLAALLLYTPNIERLDVDDHVPRAVSRVWPDLIRYRGSLCPHTFDKLSTVILGAGGMSMSQIVPLFGLAAIRTVELYGLYHCKEMLDATIAEDEIVRSLSKYSSTVEDLILKDCELDNGFVHWLIGLCRALKSFQYHRHEIKYFRRCCKFTWFVLYYFSCRMRELFHHNSQQKPRPPLPPAWQTLR